MEELNKIVEEPRMKHSKLSHSIDLSFNNPNIENPFEALKKEDQFKNNTLLTNKKHNFKKTSKIDVLLLSKSQDELESVAKQPKQKIISNEKKKIDESIAKAPSACQSVLKVYYIINLYYGTKKYLQAIDTLRENSNFKCCF